MQALSHCVVKKILSNFRCSSALLATLDAYAVLYMTPHNSLATWLVVQIYVNMYVCMHKRSNALHMKLCIHVCSGKCLGLPKYGYGMYGK